jgi:tetratricopeptide (TPR) repeat protein
MRFTREGTLQAGEIWREGLVKFPNSSLLRVKLGSFHIFRAWNLWSDDPAADYRQGGELIRQGLSIPSVSPKAQQIGHWMLAFERASVRDFDQARAEAQMAIQLAPFDASMLNDLASVQIMSGHPEVALDWAAKAAARDPGNPGWTNHTLGWAYLVQGEHEKAIAALQEGPQFGGTMLLLAIAYARLDRPEDAKAAVQKALTLDPLLTQASWRGGSFYSDPGLVDKEVADLARAGLPEK